MADPKHTSPASPASPASQASQAPQASPASPASQASQASEASQDIPLYGGVVDGIQAYRRGDAVVYSVRGGPGEVRQLLDLLQRDGVEDVVALITHRPHQEAVVTDTQPDDEPD